MSVAKSGTNIGPGIEQEFAEGQLDAVDTRINAVSHWEACALADACARHGMANPILPSEIAAAKELLKEDVLAGECPGYAVRGLEALTGAIEDIIGADAVEQAGTGAQGSPVEFTGKAMEAMKKEGIDKEDLSVWKRENTPDGKTPKVTTPDVWKYRKYTKDLEAALEGDK